MSDDWSLKNKEQYADIFMEDYTYEEKTVYYKEDIETLRKKLIEDFKKWYNETLEGNEKWEDIENIINKRFGVKHYAESKR